jgi:hypothetical protein
MAGEIQIHHAETAVTLYAHLWDKTGQIYNTATPGFESYLTANVGDYDIAMAEKGTASRFYAGDMPSVAAGRYYLTVQKRAGGSPAESDEVVGTGDGFWNGSAWYAPLQPTTEGRTLDVTAAGEAGIDWANIGSPTSVQNLSGTTVDLIAGAVDADAIATDAITADKIAANAIGASELAADAVNEIADQVWDEDIVAAHGTADTAGRAVRTLDAISDRTNNSNLNALLGVADSAGADVPGQTTDEVWDELKSAHTTPDSFGDYLDDEITSRAAPGDAMDLVAGAVDAAAIATDAIDGDAIAASAVTEIQSGLATSASIVTAQADLDDIQARLPAALVSGRMDSSVGAIATGAITADSIAADAITAAKIAADAIGASELAEGAANEIADALLDRASAVDTYTVRQLLRIMAAALAGKSSGAVASQASTMIFRAIDDSKARITGVLDANGNRTSVTVDGT